MATGPFRFLFRGFPTRECWKNSGVVLGLNDVSLPWNFAAFHCQKRFSINFPGMSSKKTEQDFEDIIENEKPYKKVMALRDILINEPEQVISLGPSGLLSWKLGKKKERISRRLFRQYPTLFDLYEDEERVFWCGFSEQAEQLLRQEADIQKAYEPVAVNKIRKLLMMAVNKRLHVPKIAHLRRDLGLPQDFQKKMVFDYPQYFHVVSQSDGPVLELTAWDSSLAVTALEKEAAAGNWMGEPKFKSFVPKRVRLLPKQRAAFEKFQALPFVSPYSDMTNVEISRPEREKRSVILIHEILSMTHEKRTIYDYLTHFHKEFMLPQSILALLLRYHPIFYVSRKGVRLSVFLKEAYKGMNLIDKNEWVLVKDRYLELMAMCEKRKNKPNKIQETKNESRSGNEYPMGGKCDLEEESEEESAQMSRSQQEKITCEM